MFKSSTQFFSQSDLTKISSLEKFASRESRGAFEFVHKKSLGLPQITDLDESTDDSTNRSGVGEEDKNYQHTDIHLLRESIKRERIKNHSYCNDKKDVEQYIIDKSNSFVKNRRDIVDEHTRVKSITGYGTLIKGFASKINSHNFSIVVVPNTDLMNAKTKERIRRIRDMMMSIKEHLKDATDYFSVDINDVSNFTNTANVEFARKVITNLRSVVSQFKGDPQWLNQIIPMLEHIARERDKGSNKHLPNVFSDELIIRCSKTYKGIVKRTSELPNVVIPGLGNIPVKDIRDFRSKNKFANLFTYMRKQTSVTFNITSLGELVFEVKGTLVRLEDVEGVKESEDNAKYVEFTNFQLATGKVPGDCFAVYECTIHPKTMEFFKSIQLLSSLYDSMPDDTKLAFRKYRDYKEDTHKPVVDYLFDRIQAGVLLEEDASLILMGMRVRTTWTALVQSKKDAYQQFWHSMLSVSNKMCNKITFFRLTQSDMGAMDLPKTKNESIAINIRGCEDVINCRRVAYSPQEFDEGAKLKYNLILLEKSTVSSTYVNSFKVFVVVTPH